LKCRWEYAKVQGEGKRKKIIYLNMENYNGYLLLGFYVASFIIVRWFLKRLFTKKRCAWCKSPSINFISGEDGNWHYEFRNKDGSKDKRVKGNYQRAGYTSKYECKKCSAQTSFKHFVDVKPSEKVKIWMRTLLSEGSGERTGKDWESKKGKRYSSSDANRKNS
jgi:hypothetical protein